MQHGISSAVRAVAVQAILTWTNLAVAQGGGGMGGMGGTPDPAKEQFFANTPVAERQEVIAAPGEAAKAAEAGDRVIVRSYPVRDLFTFRIARNPQAADTTALIEMITDAFISDVWKDVGLPQIEFVESSGMLVVRQPAAVHEKIALLLTALRKARNRQIQKDPAQDAPPPITVQTDAAQAAEERILAILDKPYVGKFEKKPLSEFLAEITRSTGLPIHVDAKVLAEASIAVDSPATYEVSEEIPLRSALSLILRELALTGTIDNESLLVTTPDAASRLLVTKVYPVLDMGSVRYPAISKAVSYGPIIQGINEWVSPNTWKEVGGPGSIDSFNPSASLVITQTFAVHQQIALLLSTMRKVRDQQLAQDAAGHANPTAEHALPPITVQTEAAQAAENRICAVLEKPFSAKFEQKPLADVLAEITRSTGLPIHVERKILEQASIALTTPVSCEVTNVSLRSALHRILRRLDLTWVIQDGLLRVTTPDHASNVEIVRVYSIHDLVNHPTAKGLPSAYAQQLNQLITDLVAPTTWDEGTGPGQQFFNAASSTFVIRQFPDVHEQIALHLSALRKARDQQHLADDPPGGEILPAEQAQAPIAVQTEAEQAAEDRIRALLQKPYSGKFNQTPLAEVLAGIKRSTGLPIQLDTEVLADASIRTDAPVNCEVVETPLRSALNKVLEPLKLVWTIDNECLLVTTPDKASSLLVLRVYPVQNLIAAVDPMNPRANRYEPLMQEITKGIAPTSWCWGEPGGPGGISPLNLSGAIVISQTFEVHEKIAKFLATLRKARRHEAPQAEPDKPADTQRPAKPPREPVAPGAGGGNL